MAIADRINEMYTHVGDVYDTITNVDLPTNKNIQNIPSTMRNSYLEIMNNGIDKIWNNWEKVTGSGTDISLSPTLEAPMKNVLNGNTYQFTTTGKNLFNIEGSYETGTGITYTKNDDGSYTLNGTANGNNFLRGVYHLNEQHTLSYKSDTSNSNVILRTRTGTPSAQTGIQDQLFVSSTSGSLTSSKQFDFVEISIVNGTTLNNFKIYIQLEKGSSVTSFEPYTGGQASPNPQYPQDIHVVSGDNAIKVESRNLLNANFSPNTINGVTQIGVNNVITLNGANNKAHSFDFPNTITYEPNTTYTTHVKIIGGSFTPYKQDSNWAIQFYNLSGTSNITLTSNNYNSVFQYSFNKKTTIRPRLWFGWEGTSRQGTDGVFDNLQIQIMVVKGAYSLSNYPTFEPYGGNIYDINLPVENKFDDSTTTNILIADDGTEQANSSIKTSIYIKVEPNTIYTCSSKLLPDKTSGWLKFSYYNASKNYLSYLYTDNTIRTITTPNNCEYIRIGYHTSIVNDVQFEVGSKANSYTPYGTTPIELCDFNTYKDNFLRTSGKNVIDLTSLIYGTSSTTSANIEKNSFAQNGTGSWGNTYFFLRNDKKNTDYTISMKALSSLSRRTGVSVYGGETTESTTGYTNIGTQWLDITANTLGATSYSFNSGNYEYLLFRFWNNGTASALSSNVDLYISEVQLEYGSLTDYEPYGSGEWYKYEPINKIVLDSSSYGGRGDLATANTYRYYFKAPNALIVSNTREVVPLYSNLGLPVDGETAYVGANGISYFSQANKMQFVFDETKSLSIDDLKTWLDNNYFEVYYLLATPNYAKITYEPLLEQLEAFYNAKSKNSQTNITQENNDLPFIIDSTMLKEV